MSLSELFESSCLAIIRHGEASLLHVSLAVCGCIGHMLSQVDCPRAQRHAADQLFCEHLSAKRSLTGKAPKASKSPSFQMLYHALQSLKRQGAQRATGSADVTGSASDSCLATP